MQITISNEIIIKNPSKALLAWANENLKVTNPEYEKRLRMNLYTGKTAKKLSLFRTNEDTLILPFGVLNRLLEVLEVLDEPSLYILIFKKQDEIDFKANIPLYKYQQVAVDKMLKANYGILQSAAGSGKTQMALALVGKLKQKTLWISHTLDLVAQSKNRALQYMDKDLIGTITGGEVNIGKGITFATVQTLANLNLKELKHEWGVIIVDEAHRVSGTPTSITRYQKVLNSLAAQHKYGLSATPHRADGLIEATYSLLGNVVYAVPSDEVKTMKVAIKPIYTGINVINTDCLNTDGTLNFARFLSAIAINEERNKLIINTINKNRPGIILSDRLEHLKKIYEPFEDVSVLISGKSKKADREKALEQMRTGEKQLLFATYSLAKEGLDIPGLENLYMISPQKDYAIITQSIGRIARQHQGKKEPICYDFVDNCMYCFKAFKKRCTIYRKNACNILENRGIV